MTIPKRLCHYTTPDGLVGILSGRTLFASNAGYLNDSQELSFGAALFRKALIARASELLKQSNDSPGIINDTADALNWTATYIRDELPRAIYSGWAPYVTCFCARNDLLSQWRGYGLHGGYAIVFDGSVLHQLCRHSYKEDGEDTSNGTVKPDSLTDVRYGKTSARPTIAMAVNQFELAVRNKLGGGSQGHPASKFGVEALEEVAADVLPCYRASSTLHSGRRRSGAWLQEHLVCSSTGKDRTGWCHLLPSAFHTKRSFKYW